MSIGEWVFKALLVLFGALGALNLGLGCLLMIEKILKEIKPKWMYVYIIVTTLGVVAIGILMKNKMI